MLTEKPQVAEPRGREYECGVSGSDCPIVVMKWGNSHGAKGAGHSRHINLVNWQQEEPIGCGGERQLSVNGTSRVSREAQARFCEGLCQEDAKASCCTEDEGRSFGAAL